MTVNGRALLLVKAQLNIHRPVDIVLTETQKDPLGVCLAYDDCFVIQISNQLPADNANWIALHELKHCQQEEHDQVQSSGKYAASLVAAGLDPELVMAVERRPLTEEERDLYVNTPYEREADKFATEHDDLYQVIFG